MAPDQEVIETFMSITGADEANAFQTLEEHKGNLNDAVIAYFGEEDRNLTRRGYYMAIDDPLPFDSNSFPPLPSGRGHSSNPSPFEMNEETKLSAIEASKQEGEMSNQDIEEDPDTEDADLARAVSLSLQMEDESEDVEDLPLVKRRRTRSSSAPTPDNNTLHQQKIRSYFPSEAEEEAEAAAEELLEQKENDRLLVAKEASLPQEPACDDADAVTFLVRMPDGSKPERRFLNSDKLQSLFDFIDVGRVVKPGSYRLVRQYPRSAFGDGESSLTIGEMGPTTMKEAFYLEWI